MHISSPFSFVLIDFGCGFSDDIDADFLLPLVRVNLLCDDLYQIPPILTTVLFG